MCWNIHRYSSVQSAASLTHAATERTLGKGWERGFVIYSASLEAVPIKQVFKIPVEQLELADQCSPESFKGFVTPNRFCFDSFDHKSAQRLCCHSVITGVEFPFSFPFRCVVFLGVPLL